jgi:Mrp family chromosome partitioning ATPase
MPLLTLADSVKQQASRSRHGLPPLSAFFVMRKKPMDAIIKGLIESDAEQRIMVISGLGGSGKTQLALKSARDFQDRYDQSRLLEYASNILSVISIFSS